VARSLTPLYKTNFKYFTIMSLAWYARLDSICYATDFRLHMLTCIAVARFVFKHQKCAIRAI
jgi:hypothetical protein